MVGPKSPLGLETAVAILYVVLRRELQLEMRLRALAHFTQTQHGCMRKRRAVLFCMVLHRPVPIFDGFLRLEGRMGLVSSD